MKSRFLTIVLSLIIGFGFFSCQKQEDVKPATPNTPNVPFRIAKTTGKMGNMGTLSKTGGYTSYVITTNSGYTYTMTFQEVDGYTYVTVTNPGGTSPEISGDCLNRIQAILEKWINEAENLTEDDNPCSIAQGFLNDFRSLRDCVPAEVQEEFDSAMDQLDMAVEEFCNENGG